MFFKNSIFMCYLYFLNKSFLWIILKTFLHVICEVRVLDMNNMDCLIEWIHIFLSSRKAILKYSTLLFFPTIAFHIEVTPLADEMYKFIQELDGDVSEAQANVVELTEAPNSDSEELKSTDSIDTTTGKTRCIILLFLNYTIQNCLLVHFSYWSLMKT